MKSELVKYCHLVYKNGFVSALDGNLSFRSGNQIYITPSSICKGEISEDDVLIIDVDGNKIEGRGKVTTEVKLHLVFYKKHKDINSVVHCHPNYSTAFAALGEGLTRAVFPEVVLSLGKVPLCKYATPSTDELPNSLLPYIDSSVAFLLENHGAVTIGKDLREAYFRMEKLENTAKTLFIARTLGREKAIPNLKLKELYDIASENYGLAIDPKNRMDYNL